MKKSIIKRVLPLLLSVLMIFSVIPMQAFAAEPTAVAAEPSINDYETFVTYVSLLEEVAYLYTAENPGVDPLNLVIKYIRTGVDRYNSGSWNIMAGYEDAAFAEYVAAIEEMLNAEATCEEEKIYISALKNINNFYLPNGDYADLGHVFGTMDITYHNKGSQNHADVGGWAGDLVDLLELSDINGVSGTLEEMVADISANYLGKDFSPVPGFSTADIQGDIDAYYIMQALNNTEYSYGVLADIMLNYFTEDLDNVQRAGYLLKNRLGTTGNKTQIRDIVYNEYTKNKVVSTLEGTRTFTSTDLANLRKAVCYSFADYLCALAGDYVDDVENTYYKVFSNEFSTLAPGITQEIKYANTTDGYQMVYYIATADITRDDVNVFANYNNNDPSQGWAMSRVIDQANAAQNKYGNPESEYYIENYNVIASTNGSGYDMYTGQPGGLLVMGGVEYHPINSSGFFGILKDGTAVIGTTEEYKTIYKDKVQEGIAGFGATLIKDGKIVVSKTDTYFNDRASRTAVGITKTGKVVLMVLDGRQEPFSCGGSMEEIAQIMLEAGCVNAVNLDGGGSTTYVAKQVGDEELSLINRPSDGFARSVSTSLMMVSTAPSSTKFDHAVLETEYNYLTVGTSLKITPVGVSATGNATDLPEGAYWEVSNSRWGSITEDGVFTALRDGDVDVNLMLDGNVIGSKTMKIVTPDNLYYSKSVIDAVYGAKVNLPIVALYENKPVAVNENDITFTLSNEGAGAIDDFVFVGNETSGIKVVVVTAALAANSECTAEITINLYNQGEATFDFEQATGGDRQLAWDRQVSNSITEDAINYTIVDTNEDMVTSYIVAIDMTEIPIPEVLSDLVYMLPGADVEGANAWAFLCQLAQRISSLTEVKATLKFDSNFDVDYSNLTIVNEYFSPKDIIFDDETNTLTLVLKWKKQTQAIDIATANPLCIVSGIKLTPKSDADWGDKNSITAVNTGNISYQVYMRASALYSFAVKEENQQTYGIYPYVNPEDTEDAGGYFENTYKQFYDTYTLIGALKDGWIYEDGGFAYYVEGVKLTGVNKIDGYYYDFGENGINAGQEKYTGLFFDKADNVYRYSKLGVITGGWHTINGEWYYFNNSTKAAAVGVNKIGGIKFEFEETGKLVSGVWVKTLKGIRYYYGPSYYVEKWQKIDGEWYYFRNGYRITGIQSVGSLENAKIKIWYDFGEDGICRNLEEGFYEINGGLYYIADGVHKVGLNKIGNDYYFFTYNGPAIKNKSYYAWETHCDLPCSTYYFGEDGKMANGIVKTDNGYFRYLNGKVDWTTAGLYKIDGEYYFVDTKGRCVTGTKYAWATYCDLPCDTYYFREDGRMANGIVETENGNYCYFNGQIDWTKAGLRKIGDDYYFVDTKGKCITGTKHAWATYCDLPTGTYEFAEDGKMLQGIVKKADGYYYYVNGRIDSKNAGLTKVGDDYYFVASNGKVVVGEKYAWATNCDLPCDTYYFLEDGKMANGIVETANGNYCYFNGKIDPSKAGLRKIGDDYYFVDTKGKCITGTKYAWATFCDLPCSTYEFGADGKMLHGLVEKNGVTCFYVYGKPGGSNPGLTKVGDDYYFINTRGECVTGTYHAWATNCDLPTGTYEFAEDGKMLDGFVTKADGRYYYVKGNPGRVGLNYIDGYYYFVNYSGKLVTNREFYVWETNDLLLETTYTFNELGQIIG